MSTVAAILIALVAAEHLYFLYLEMFAWTRASTRRSFGTTAEFAEASKALAANQGLYNGFLAAGLIWSVVHPDPTVGRQIALFFLACVLAAAAYGGWSVKPVIAAIQGVPALIALAALIILS
jgi:putative membrane protein